MSNGMTTTKNYDLFSLSNTNRPLDLSRRGDLRKSMQEWGFLPQPILCFREGGKLIVADGQHRLAIAQELGLPVPYVVTEKRPNIADLNNTQKTWRPADYAECYAQQGNRDYQDLIYFAAKHDIPTNLAMSMLSNSLEGFENNRQSFRTGEWKITTRPLAGRVASLYVNIVKMSKPVRGKCLIFSLFAICQIDPAIDDTRLLAGAARRPEMLIKYGSRDGYLDMLQDLYNFGRSKLFPLRVEAENAMRRRNPANRGTK